jgi:hypothetical protein
MMGVTRKLFRGVIKERLETELQGKISEIRNEVFQGRGMYGGMFLLRQAVNNMSRNYRVIFGVYRLKEYI